MVSKMICLLLLGMVHADEAEKEQRPRYDAMAKFAVAPMMPSSKSRVSAPAAFDVSEGVSPAVLKSLANLEEQSQEMKVEYQRLRARIQKLPQADGVDSSSSFGWLAGMIASVGLASSIGVAAIRKYTGQGQQGSESTTAFQIPLVAQAPQRRAGPIVAQESESEKKEDSKSEEAPPSRWYWGTKSTTPDTEERSFLGYFPEGLQPDQQDSFALDDLKGLATSLNPVVGYFDPLGLSKRDWWGQGNAATISWLRHSEIKHGRVAMAGVIGYWLHENNFHWPLKLEGGMPGGWNWYNECGFEGLSAPDTWFATPAGSRAQILTFIGILEIWSESSYVLEKDGVKHYMRGGKPGYFPSFKEVPHPCPFPLYDPFQINKDKPESWKAAKLASEINNGRLAMIGLMSFLVESKIPGAVPFLTKLGTVKPMSEGLEVMAPFGPATGPNAMFVIPPEVLDMVQ